MHDHLWGPLLDSSRIKFQVAFLYGLHISRPLLNAVAKVPLLKSLVTGPQRA